MEQKTESRVVSYRYNEESRTVEGYAATFEPYDMGMFVEVVSRDAFGDVSQYDVRALFNHDPDKVFARSNRGNGTLQLEVDDKGLKYRFELPNTTLGNDVHEMLKRGDISQSSWAFRIESDTWEHGEKEVRTINKVSDISDVSLVTYPANPDTSVALRSLQTSKSKNPDKMENQTAEKAKTETADTAVRSEAMVDSSAVSRGISTQEKRDFAKFNIVDAVNYALGNNRGGLVAELDQQARSSHAHAREEGRFTFPNEFINEFRSHSATGQTTNPGDQGGNTIETSLGQMIGALRPSTVLSTLGATYMNGLEGNVDFPVQDNTVDSDWKTETAATSEKAILFSNKSLRPNRTAAHMVTTTQLLAQSSVDVQNFIISELNDATARLIDIAGLRGTGSSNQPSGILTDGTEIASIDVGAGLTYENLILMEQTLAEANAKQNAKYLSTYAIAAALKNTKLDAGSGRFILEGMLNPSMTANGYEFHGSNLMAANQIIMGNFSDLIIAEWGAPSILVDPYTARSTGQVKIYIERFIDTLVRRPESFVYAIDQP